MTYANLLLATSTKEANPSGSLIANNGIAHV